MSELRRPQVLLFDAGNTLVFLDHDALAYAAHDVAPELTGIALRRTESLAKKSYEAGLAAGMSHEEGWHLYIRTIFEAAGLPRPLAVEATVLARAAHDEFNLWRKVPDGLHAALQVGLSAGLRYGIVSNSEGRLLELLERVSIAQYFEHVIDSTLEGVRKPDPEIFWRALSRMQASAADTMYAGDIPNVDVDGARAAGLDAVLIDTLSHYPDYAGAPRFASVSALIETLCP
ncbi:MAG: putative hydrolase [Myxococcaceae bacterium]|nr:putative hydrolase [Myxococcaceae bacterium]